MRWITCFLLLLIMAATLFAQSPCKLNWKKETAFIVGGGMVLSMSKYLSNQTPLFSPDELLTMNPNDINAFDRVATRFSSEPANVVSNYLWYGSHGLPLLFLLGKRSRSDFGEIFLMYGETTLLNSGLTFLAKSTFRRPRPYVFDPEADIMLKQQTGARASFVSGHTSMTAANTFFVAKVFSDYYPNSKWKPVIWTTAVVLPAVTGYLRVRAGRHYPTDAIAGYALGAAVGYLVPYLHHNKLCDNPNIQMGVGMNSGYFMMTF